MTSPLPVGVESSVDGSVHCPVDDCMSSQSEDLSIVGRGTTAFMFLTEAPHVNQESLREIPGGRKKVVKRQSACPDGEYYTGFFCCKLCATGTHRISNCTEQHGNPHCKACSKGVEYFKDQECHRCTTCDRGEGLETLQNCTAEENTKCQCIEGYFCNAASRCTHCEPCDKCENGKILEKCTKQKNTLCEENHRRRIGVVAAVVVAVTVLIVATITEIALSCFHEERNRSTLHNEIIPLHKAPATGTHDPSGNDHSVDLPETYPDHSVDLPETYPDVDLTLHFVDIAKILDRETTLLFVRKKGMTDPIIEEVMMDNMLNTNEQKIKLMRKWYEEHGKRGAFTELIRTLKEIQCLSSAEKIFKQISGG